MNISHWIERHAGFTPGKSALRFGAEDITYAELEARVAQAAGMLSGGLGVEAGDRVGFLGMNSPETLVLFFACARVGAVLAPLNWRLAPPEHQVMLADFAPQAIFVEADFQNQMEGLKDELDIPHYVAMEGAAEGWAGYAELLAAASPLAAADGAGDISDDVLICFTSGATGAPKGTVLTQNAIFYNAINSMHGLDISNDDVILTTIPLFHVGGLNVMTTPGLHIGATVVLQRSFDPNGTYDDIVDHAVTQVVLVPAQIQAMAAHPRWEEADFSSLRAVCTGSTNVPVKVMRNFIDRGISVTQVYGLTETTPIAVYMTAREPHERAGAAGKPALHCEIRVVDNDDMDVAPGETGEILTRGPVVMREYLNKPEVTAEALRGGWFHTGDMGHFDEGYLYIDDRRKDMIISGGENIYPAELENVLADCPALAEAAVVGRPDDKWGEVAVVVAVRKNGETIDEAGVLALFDQKLARFKHPKGVIFSEALPRNAMGKVLKDDLRKLVGQQEKSEA